MSVIACEVSNGRGVVRVGGAEERADIRVSKGWEGGLGVGGARGVGGGRSVEECSRDEPIEDELFTKLGLRGRDEEPPLV